MAECSIEEFGFERLNTPVNCRHYMHELVDKNRGLTSYS